MDSSSNLTSLPEESFGEQEQLQHQSKETSSAASSAFSSIPNRPPIQASSQKYSPIGWLGYFDQEDDIHIPDSNDVNGSFFWLLDYLSFTYIRQDRVDQLFFVCMEAAIVVHYIQKWSGVCPIEPPRIILENNLTEYLQEESTTCLPLYMITIYLLRLSFALAASKIKEKARVVAMDLRGHGKSSTENELDLSIETLCDDVVAVLNSMYGDTPPAIVLVGHSMGGSVAIQVAAKKALSSLSGLVVVDVVEGTAMASLIHMQKILSSRMQYFSTIEKAVSCDTPSEVSGVGQYHLSLYDQSRWRSPRRGQALANPLLYPSKFKSHASFGPEVPVPDLGGADVCGVASWHISFLKCLGVVSAIIEWSVRGGSLRNIESARVSIPGTLKYDDSKKCYIYRAQLEETEQHWRGWEMGLLCEVIYLHLIPTAITEAFWVSITIASATNFWVEMEKCYWYEGLSEKFLSCPAPKLLLLAGTDRLDRLLTIGQMQGKFQMVVVRHTGHAIQEDVPYEFASLILNFISRNRIGPHGIELPDNLVLG
ncbi:hypothetical protein RHSIM_Rhsim02G0145500 [Rhododendron simsii]|uniref:protein phosphatase methylesterase-1 n=1 Tax=Rhododendron simsii TaxID=118357 RepID=A0A834HD25_RHOSS|nr:hypothetical protein RHSIM_Rhsim02G0145500 [Rhododendron simsii]